jgi:hypothetical protein
MWQTHKNFSDTVKYGLWSRANRSPVHSYDHAHFGEGTVPIRMDEVNCIGNEQQLTGCRFLTQHDCSHSEDAGVSCTP